MIRNKKHNGRKTANNKHTFAQNPSQMRQIASDRVRIEKMIKI